MSFAFLSCLLLVAPINAHEEVCSIVPEASWLQLKVDFNDVDHTTNVSLDDQAEIVWRQTSTDIHAGLLTNGSGEMASPQTRTTIPQFYEREHEQSSSPSETTQTASSTEAFVELLPFLVSWHVLYYIFFFGSQQVSEKFNELDNQRGEKGFWAASLVSMVHAIVIVIISSWALWQEPSLLGSNGFFKSTPLSLLACRIFLGYILSDFLVAVYYNSRWQGWVANLIHHASCAITWWQLIVGSYGQGLVLFLMLMEVTTPFVNLRWFLAQLDMKSTSLFFVNGWLMMLSWFLFRIVGYAVAAERLYAQRADVFSTKLPAMNRIIFLSCFIIGAVLMVFWFYKMVKGAWKMLSNSEKSDEVSRSTSNVSGMSNLPLTPEPPEKRNAYHTRRTS